MDLGIHGREHREGQSREVQMKALALILLIVLAVPTALFNGWMLTFMWGWFIVPLGVQMIGVAHAWGLLLTAGFFTMSCKTSKDSDDDETALANSFIRLISSMVACALLTGFGAMVHSFM